MQKKEARFPIFQERFLKERQRRELSQADFAVFLGLSRPTIGFYENGERLPDALTLKKIAEKCEVTSDYLLGLSINSKPENADIGKRLGLSDTAIHILELHNTTGVDSAIIATINLLIEQEFFIESAVVVDLENGEENIDWENVHKEMEEKEEKLREKMDKYKPVELLSSIADYFTVEIPDDDVIELSEIGHVRERSTLVPNVAHLGPIRTVQSKTIIEKVLLMEIQEKAEKLKAKLVQCKEENKQEDDDENGNNPEKKK